MEATAIAPNPAASTVAAGRGFNELGGDAFFKLLIAQLANQDPLEPTSNQELLQQISSIRDIELSSTLTRSLTSVVDQQRLGSSAALLGQYVSGPGNNSGDGTPAVAGVVVGLRFDGQGAGVLVLDNGGELPFDQVQRVMPPEQAASQMVGQFVAGMDRSDAVEPALVEGIVTSVREESPGEIVLELDSGGEVKLSDVITVSPAGAEDMDANV